MCLDDWPYHKKTLEVEPRATPAKQPSSGDAWNTVTPIVSAVMLWSLQCVQEPQRTCRLWLQENIPWQFWQLFMEYLQDRNSVHRKATEQINSAHGYGVGKTLRKWMSYDGAVLAWPGYPTSQAHWVDSGTGEGYVDCGHRIYFDVAFSTWPKAFSASSANTVDDVIEAFFAYAWKCRCKGITQPEHILHFVSVLNNLCFATWLESMMPDGVNN